ncbi:MAG: TauD/TfdA family dioxygenase [Pseudomonadota bacterium]
MNDAGSGNIGGGVETSAGLEIKPLSATMAAEVTGLDLSQPMDQPTRDAVLSAFLKYKVLAFRNQKLSKSQQMAFTEQFGTLERHAKGNVGQDEFPLVHMVTNLGPDGQPTGVVKSTRWHSDKSFRPAPSMATILHAVTLPPDGGDTCFADMQAGFEALPEDEKDDLAEMTVVHSWEHSRDNVGKTFTKAELEDAPDMTHPLVRVHPDTGERALFLGMHAAFLGEMSKEDSLAKIEQLEEHCTQSRFVYRHNWQQGDVLMWDNRCLLHRADPNFDAAKFPRVMHRTCLRGTPTS